MRRKQLSHALFAQLAIALVVLGVLFASSPLSSAWKGETSEGNLESSVDPIRNKNLSFGELSGFFSALAEEQGGGFAYRALAYAANNSYLTPNVDTHLLGHVVGDVLYAQKGFDGMGECTHDLRNACSHTIVVGAFLEFGTEVLEKINEACKDAPGGRGAYTMCFHGFGHGVLAYAGYDMEQAVGLCEHVGTEEYNYREHTECVGGVTMEMMAGVHDPREWHRQRGKYFDEDDPLAPCNREFMPKKVRPICYTYLTPHLFEEAGITLGNPDPAHFKKAFSFCAAIPEENEDDRNSCFGAFGKEFVVLANERNVQNVEHMADDRLKIIYEWCALSENEEVTTKCMFSALDSLYWGGENNPDASIRFCSSVSAPSDRERCFEHLIENVSYYREDAAYREGICTAVPGDFNETCREELFTQQ